MAFKELLNLDADTSTAIGGFNKKERKDNPTEAEGYFLGTKVVESSLSATGKANLHILQTDKGNLGIWGKTNMDQKLAAVTPGVRVRITFVGTQPSKKGSPMYLYKVLVDADDSIEVASQASTLETEEYDDNPNAEFDREEEVEAPRAAAPDAGARQAKVKELLGKARAKTA